MRKAGGESIFVPVDVSRSDEVEGMVKSAVSRFGGVDLAFNNAGVTLGGALHEISEEIWDKVVDINLKGVWLCMKYEIPEMLKSGTGSIVNTASIDREVNWEIVCRRAHSGSHLKPAIHGGGSDYVFPASQTGTGRATMNLYSKLIPRSLLIHIHHH